MSASHTDLRQKLRLTLVTQGDPAQLSGGYLYHARMAAAAPRHDAQLEFLSIPRRPFPLATLDARTIMGRLKAPDAVLLDSIVAGVVAPWLGSRTSNPPVVAVIHQQPGGVDYWPLRSAVQARLDLYAYRRVSRLIAASEQLADRLRAAGLPADRIRVVPPGRDPAEGQPPRPAGDLRSGRALAALCISNWTPNKGIHWLLEAIASLPATTVTLHLVGNPSSEPRYARQLRQRLANDDLRGRVVIHGSLPAVEVAGLLQAADVVVHPSAHEAYATVCAEAMAAGVPVIASRVDNLLYLVREGIDGLLTSPGDVRAIASALALLAADSERRSLMGASARSRAMAWPTWAESADRFFGVIRESLAGK